MEGRLFRSHLVELCSKAHSKHGEGRQRMWGKRRGRSWKGARPIRRQLLGSMKVEALVGWLLRACMSRVTSTNLPFLGNGDYEMYGVNLYGHFLIFTMHAYNFLSTHSR